MGNIFKIELVLSKAQYELAELSCKLLGQILAVFLGSPAICSPWLLYWTG